MTLLITGGSGFVGQALVKRLGNLPIRLATRPDSIDWHSALVGISTIVHLAARVHVMHDTVADPLAAFRAVNVDGTLKLAKQAALAGVKRFVFVSSIKVNGEETLSGRRFFAEDLPKPSDPYGISKYEAENGLRIIAKETGLTVVIIRPVMIYGPGVKGNFLSMMRWLHTGVPLPFGAINNLRSLVALDNLIDLIITCLDHPVAANQTFLVSDGEDLSMTELLKLTASAMGIKARLIPVPASIIQFGASLLGKRDVGQRLCGSLQVDISKTQELLGWTPSVTVDQALKKTADHFLCNQLG